MTGSSGPSAFLETLAGRTGPSPIFSQALAEDKSIASVRNQNPGGKNRWNLFVRGPGERQQRNCCRCVASVKKSVFLLIFGVGGVPRDAPRAPRAPPRAKHGSFVGVRTSPGRFLRPFGVTLGDPYGGLRRRLGAPVAAQGHKKADAGPHSVSNAVKSATAAVPGVAFCHENIVNNGVLTTAPFSQTCSKRVAQGGPKVSCGGPFGHLGSSRGASLSTLDTTGRQQDAALRTDAFPGPKLVPDTRPKWEMAAGGTHESE